MKYESRFRITNEHAADYGTWYPWESVTFYEAKEIQGYIDQGKDHYELRIAEHRNLTESEVTSLRST